jgi:hypothetical protein
MAAYLSFAVRVSALLTEGWHNRTMKRLSSRKSFSMKEMLQRIDRVAGDLNVLLVVIVIGLATLDLTFLVTQNVVNRLPPITRIAPDAAPPG